MIQKIKRLIWGIWIAANVKKIKLVAVPAFLILLLFSPFCFARQFSYKNFFAEQEKALLLIQQKNPVLYNFEKRNLEIMKEIQKIKEDYRKGRISKEDAQIKLRPLIKEQIEINTNHEYLIEQRMHDIIENPSAY